MERSHLYFFSKKEIRLLICSLVLLAGVIFLYLTHSESIQVQAQAKIKLDYIILIDVSGSMNDFTDPTNPQSSTLWNDLIPVIKEYIMNLPIGSSVKIFTFGEYINAFGPWEEISEFDKRSISNEIDNFRPNEQQTRFWDAVCIGVDYMTELQEGSVSERFQTLISFTDGKDNYSSKKPSDCLGNYDNLCVDGNVYWIHYAYKDSDMFAKSDCGVIIDIIDPKVVPPITTVLLLPSTFDLQNIYETGRGSRCVVPWASSTNIYGNQGYKIGQPILTEGNLPSDVTLNICERGTDCNRENITILQKESCLELYLVNYNKNLFDQGTISHFAVDVPIVRSDSAETTLIIYPEILKFRFHIEPDPPTPTFTTTSTVTSTATSTSTATIAPTNTATPTYTPTTIPADVFVRCEEQNLLDFGTLKKPDKVEKTTAEKDCEISWEKSNLTSSIGVNLLWDDTDESIANLAQFIWLEQDGEKVRALYLSPTDEEIKIVIEIPYEAWKTLPRRIFNGRLVFSPQSANLLGDVQQVEDSFSLGVRFKVMPPLSPLFFLIPGLGVVVLAVLVIIGTRPRFPKHIVIESMGLNVNPASSFFDWWTGTVYLGGGAKAILGLGDEQELIVKLTPNIKTSFIGQILLRKAEFTAELTPLGEASIWLQTEGEKTTEPRTIYEGTEFTIFNNDKHYRVRVFQKETNEENAETFSNTYRDDPFGGF